VNSENLIRTLVYTNQQCSGCEKKLKREKVAWVHVEEEIKGLISKRAKYYCVPCGNKIIEQEKSSEKISGEVCFASACKNKIKEEYYQCQDSKKKFCSQRHFEEVCGLYCSCCGKENNEEINYLERIKPERTAFQKTLPLLVGCLVILITVVMIILVKEEERRKFSLPKKSFTS
jgi:hypothetical protein